MIKSMIWTHVLHYRRHLQAWACKGGNKGRYLGSARKEFKFGNIVLSRYYSMILILCNYLVSILSI